jgi:lactate dehydrogenase-like 2-hydroxyacid dehydrogenase
MKRIIAYGVRPDEAELLQHYAASMDLDIKSIPHKLTMETIHEVAGYQAISTLATNTISREILQRLGEEGIRYLALRSAGFDNVDLPAAAEYGIRVSHAMYSPNSVAEYTVLMILMCVRKMKQIMLRNQAHDFTLPGNRGLELRNLTIGIVGTGRIGQKVAENLSGFGGTLLACDMYPKPELTQYVDYVDWPTLLQRCDLITLHAPYNEETHHLINAASLRQMKAGAGLINCSRGDLIDTAALVQALESGHISAAALDVLEGELGIFHQDYRTRPVVHPYLARLQQLPNVIVTPHLAFYTDQAVQDMVQFALLSLVSYLDTGASEWEVPFDFSGVSQHR